MKPLCYLLLIISLVEPRALLAQKSAPVAGDAAQLVDLLKKDYNSIDPSTRSEEVVKDRAFAISTLKSYLTEVQKNALIAKIAAATTNKTIKTYSDQFIDYRNAQQLLASYSSTITTISPNNDAEAGKINFRLKNLSDNIETTKGLYHKAKYEVDKQELTFLMTVYNNNNEYIEYIIDQFAKKYDAIDANGVDALAKSNPNATVQKGLPFLGGDMGFEVVIEGLSKFLAKRIKEELTTEVINKIKEWLSNPSEDNPLAELKILLPRTNTYLLNFKASQVTNFPNEIKQYIEDDFSHIIDNMEGLRNSPRIKRLIANHPDVDFAMEALAMIPNLSKLKNPVDYFETIENSRNLNRWKESKEPVKFNIANTLRLSSMLAHSLTIIDNGQPRFAGSDFFSTYGSDLNFYLLYVGFLNQQNLKFHDIQFLIKADALIPITQKDSAGQALTANSDLLKFQLSAGMRILVGTDLIAVKTNIESLRKDREFFEKLLFQIGDNSEKVYTSTMEIKKASKTGQKIGADSIYTFVKSLINLADEVTSAGDTLTHYLIAKIGSFDKKITAIQIDYSTGDAPKYTITAEKGNGTFQPLQLKEKAKPYFAVANKTNDILLDLQKKKYTTAIIKALEVTTTVLPNRSTQSIDLLRKSIILIPETKENWITKPFIRDWFSRDWFTVIPIVKQGTATEIGKEVATSATRIYDELNSIKNYYQLHYEIDDAIWNGIGVLMFRVGKMKIKGKIEVTSATELDAIGKLLANSSFRYVLVSYYLQGRVDEFADEMEKGMKHITVDIKGIAKRVFTDTEAAKAKELFFVYVDAAFTFLIDNDKSKLNAAGTQFKDFALACLMRAPDEFNLQINENVLKLIHFINDMAVANNSDDIEKAIEAFALPSGSYSIKRDAIFNISINSFPGILPALELTWKDKTCYESFSPAFTAPVGFSITGSNGKGASHGVFIPIIDIGAVTRMHLGNDIEGASTLPEFSFLSIFSPGLYYHWGFRKTPISLNVGAQYGPGLREVMSNGDTKIYESVRIGIGLVLDIPLLNLHTKPRYRK